MKSWKGDPLHTSVTFADALRLRQALGDWRTVKRDAVAVGFSFIEEKKQSPVSEGKGHDLVSTSEFIENDEVKAPEYGGGRRHIAFVLPVYRAQRATGGSEVWPGSEYDELSDDHVVTPDQPAEEALSLTPWERLQGFLRSSLGRPVLGGRVDVPRLVTSMSRGEVICKIPVKPRHSCTGRAVVIVDYSMEALPFWDDFDEVSQRLAKERGRSSVKVLELRKNTPIASLQRHIPEGVPVLVLGTMGRYRDDIHAQQGWIQMGRWLRDRGQTATALLPVPRELWKLELAQLWKCVLWDSWNAIPAKTGQLPLQGDSKSKEDAEDLLTSLAVAARIPFPLAREMRLTSERRWGVGAEYEAWQHSDCRSYSDFYEFDAEKQTGYLIRLKRETPEWRRLSLGIIERHHADCSRLRQLEVVLMGLNVIDGFPDQVEELNKRLWEVVQRLRKAHPGSPREDFSGIPLWVRYVVDHLPVHLRGAEEISEPLGRAVASTSYWEGRESPRYPLGINYAAAQDEWRLLHGKQEKREWLLYEISEGIRYSPGLIREGFFLGRLATAGEMVTVQESGEVREIRLKKNGGDIPWSGNDLLFQSGIEDLGLLRIERPVWAHKMIRRLDRWGAETENGGKVLWKDPEELGLGKWVDEDGQPVDINWDLESMLPADWKVGGQSEVPEWATSGGKDNFGRYAVWEHEGVAFRFRWIPPGEFLMGSPEDEVGRYDDEGPQHEVRLTQGFWMLETPVTQEQWRTNGSKNPSHFAGEKRPVDRVSWNDCQSWLKSLKAHLAEAEARLPTEAEWEYACRAGTHSAFNNGMEYTERTGKDPALEEVGWYYENSDGKTHEVARKLSNAWGLSDMHGNVWEWCLDWSGSYPRDAQEDPQGPMNGSSRVLRGGGWFYNARLCRSASRYRIKPGNRNNNFGFRFVLQASSKQESGSGARPGPAKGAPPGGDS